MNLWRVAAVAAVVSLLVGVSYWYSEVYRPDWCGDVDVEVYRWSYDSGTGMVDVEVLDRGRLTPETAVIQVGDARESVEPVAGELTSFAVNVSGPPAESPVVYAEGCR